MTNKNNMEIDSIYYIKKKKKKYLYHKIIYKKF